MSALYLRPWISLWKPVRGLREVMSSWHLATKKVWRSTKLSHVVISGLIFHICLCSLALERKYMYVVYLLMVVCCQFGGLLKGLLQTELYKLFTGRLLVHFTFSTVGSTTKNKLYCTVFKSRTCSTFLSLCYFMCTSAEKSFVMICSLQHRVEVKTIFFN